MLEHEQSSSGQGAYPWSRATPHMARHLSHLNIPNTSRQIRKKKLPPISDPLAKLGISKKVGDESETERRTQVGRCGIAQGYHNMSGSLQQLGVVLSLREE